MSHRRKSSHPLNKQKRICNVVDRVLAAKTREHEKHVLLGTEQKNNTLQNETAGKLQPDENRSSPPTSQTPSDGLNQSSVKALFDSSNQNIAIPDDLFKDFQALKSATHLDTTELMRKLLKEYASGGSSMGNIDNTDHEKQSYNEKLGHDVPSLSEYYKTEQKLTKSDHDIDNNSNEPLDLSTLKTEKQEDLPVDYSDRVVPVTVVQELSAQVNVRQGSHLFPANIETQRLQHCFGNGAGMYFYPLGGSEKFPIAVPESSMKVPTVIHESAEGNCEQQPTEAHVGSKSPTGLHVITSEPQSDNNVNIGSQFQAENYREVQFQNGSVKITGTKLHPEIQMGELTESGQNSPSVNVVTQDSISMAETSKNTPSTPLVIPTDHVQVPTGVTHEIISNMAQVQQPMQPVPEVMTPTELSNMAFAQNFAAATAQYQMQETQKPARTQAKTQKGGGKKSGQMKLIAENTSHHGVYTSVLKLPWSRRTRTPKSDSGEKSSSQQQHKQHKQHQLEQQQEQTQQPMMLFPVATTNLPSTQGVFIPASNFTMPTVTSTPVDTSVVSATVTTPTTTQPMMMVYPNASFGSVSKPARKRGRPPKVPVLARMLAEANKRAALDIQMPNFFQNFPACQQPAAIVLNVNNMVNPSIPGSITTLNPITTSIAQSTNPPIVVAASTEPIKVEQIPIQQTLDMQQSVPVLSAPVPIQQVQATPEGAAPSSVSRNINNDTRYRTLVPQHSDNSGQTLEKLSPETKSQPSPTELKTMKTTSVANTETGALYQEMILSSKSLVNVKPRRRQTTTELLKSKSGADSFICTSFRLRSLSGKSKEKRTSAVTGMKRRGRPPKRRIAGMFDHQTESTKSLNQLPSQVPIPDSQTMSQLYSQTHATLDPLNSPTNLGRTSLDLAGENDIDGDRCSHGISLSQEPQLFDGAIDSNYDNPLLANQFCVEGSLSDGGLQQDGSQGRLLFQSDDEHKVGVTCDRNSDDSSNDEPDDCLPNDMFQKLFHCKVCNEIIPVEKKNEHWEKHARVKIKCSSCKAPCYKHLTKEQLGSEAARERLQCDSCETRLEDPDTTGHSLTTIVQCDVCLQHFPDGRTLRRHIKVDHAEVYARRKSKFAGMRKHSEEPVKDNTNAKSNELKMYRCPVEDCQKKFYSKFRIKLHMKKWHTGRQSTAFTSEIVKKKANVQAQDKNKIKHFTVKGYTCSWPGCEEEFQTERNLKVHLLIHRDEKPLKCDFCDYRCRQKTALGWHTRKHHPEASNVPGTHSQPGLTESPATIDENGDE